MTTTENIAPEPGEVQSQSEVTVDPGAPPWHTPLGPTEAERIQRNREEEEKRRGRWPLTAAREAAGEPDIIPPAEPPTGNLVNPSLSAAGLSGASEDLDVLRAIARVLNAELKPSAEQQALENIRRATGRKETAFKKMVTIARNAVAAPEWFELVPKKADGEPRAVMATAVVGLTEDPIWQGVIWLDEFTGMITVRHCPPYEGSRAGFPCDARPWTDDDTLETLNWFQKFNLDMRKDAVFDAVALVASRNTFHPVRDYLNQLQWRGKHLIDEVPHKYLGCEDTPYNCAVFRRWMISAVARVFDPGCKADCAIILEGGQGIGKSTALKVLAVRDEWFTDEIADLGSKDAALQIRGIWILELAELDSMTRAEVSRAKAFMSRTEDRFRPPYGRLPITAKRQCVFAGSVNDDEYLRDPTGGRRWWPLKCGEINIAALRALRHQLWAEAVIAWGSDEPWHLDDPAIIAMAKVEQDDRYISDAFESEIAEWLKANPQITSVTVGQLIAEALKIIDRAKWSKAEQTRVGAAMKRLGWSKVRDSTGERLWRWYRPSHEPNRKAPKWLTD